MRDGEVTELGFVDDGGNRNIKCTGRENYMITQSSIAPLTPDTFWINYSNLLLSVWSVPSMRGNLHSSPAQVLAYFDLATVPDSKFEIISKINEKEASFDDQYKLFLNGHRDRKYVLYVPDEYPGVAARGANDLTIAAANTADCCCCSCCPCCSCF